MRKTCSSHQKVLRILLGLLIAFCFPYFVQGQNLEIKGKVLDASTNEAIPGASVILKGTNVGTLTDLNGEFTISVPIGSTLVVSFVGMSKQEIKVTNTNFLTINLETEVLELNEVVVTGYSTQRKADLTGSVSVIGVDRIASSTSGSAMRAIQSKVPGMLVTYNGSPTPNSTIRIRGEGTLNNNDPLYIVDGIPTTRSMGELSTLDIESIQVLKDASSASIFGSRAANGVIIITTRKAKLGTSIDFKASYTLVSSAKPYDLMNTKERGIAQFWAIMNDNPNADPNLIGIGQLYIYTYHKDASGNLVLDDVSWKEYIDPEKTMKAADTDWQKEILRTGQVQQYNLTLSSGNDKAHSVFSADYYDNQGTIKGSFFVKIIFLSTAENKLSINPHS